MAQIELQEVTVSFRGPPLLDGVSTSIDAGQRIGLLGRNGAGKSTFLRVLTGETAPDHGECRLIPGTRVAFLPQDVPRDLCGSIHDVVIAGITDDECDEAHRWQAEQRVTRLFDQMSLDGPANVQSLSSGMKRRVLLARAIASDPNVLLLDEPTNHLDIEAITWLEDFLNRWPATLIFVTHDRAFLRRLASRILEIDRGRLFDWCCDYETFLIRKEQALAAEEKQNALFDKKLAQEEAWIRQGIKARRTRNEGRVRALEEMRKLRRERRERVGRAKLEVQAAERSGALVARVENISFGYSGRPIVDDFSTTIMRGDKIGIIGPNGAGKTTLLRLLLGQVAPHSGQVRLGSNLQFAYFDQLREQLDETATVQENLGAGGEMLSINGGSRHVLGYLQDFLFSPDRARTAVQYLSGGERNRLLLARMFARPANVIVLDEPTNDLDAETLELLEGRLVEFPGTLLVVSHDREFLNNVATNTLVFEAHGVHEYVGGYDDWIRQRRPQATIAQDRPPAKQPAQAPSTESTRRLSYHEQRELGNLPAAIELLETETAALHSAMTSPDFYRQSPAEIASRHARLAELEEQLKVAYLRWEELERLAT